jgi:uncharacterized protein involved in outer membrane biogenesis
MRQTIKWTLISLFGLYTFAGFFIVPMIVESKLPTVVNSVTKGKLSVDDVDFNPWIFRIDLNNVAFANPQGETLAELEQLVVNVNLLELLWGNIAIERIRLERPAIHIVKYKDGQFNFAWLMAGGETPPVETKEEANGLPHIKLNELFINAGGVTFRDETRAEPFNVALEPLYLNLQDIDTGSLTTKANSVQFLSDLDDGGEIQIKTKVTSYEPLALQTHVALKNGSLYTGWRYIKEMVPFKITDGRLDVNFDVAIDLSRLDEMRIHDISTSLRKFQLLSKTNAPVLGIDEIVLSGSEVLPLQQKVTLNEFKISGVRLNTVRHKDGSINLTRVFVPQATGDESAASDKQNSTEEKPDTSSQSQPWQVTLERFRLSPMEVTFTDETLTPALTSVVSDINLGLHKVTSRPQERIGLDFGWKLNGQMVCEGKGSLEHTPVKLGTSAGCQGLELAWLNPYIKDAASKALEVYDLDIASGTTGLGAEIAFEQEGNRFVLSEGEVQIEGLGLHRPSNQADLAGFKSLTLNGVGFTTETNALHIDEIVWRDPYAHVKRDKAGVINLAQVAVGKASKDDTSAKSSTAGKEKSTPFSATIDRFDLRSGAVSFSDAVPSGGAVFNVTPLDLTVKHISSQPGRKLDYSLGLKINKKSRITASGKLQHTPLWQSGTLALEKMDLTELNPYVNDAVYANIESGSLSYRMKGTFDSRETVRKKQLGSEGKLQIDDLNISDTRDNSRLFGIKELLVNPVLFDLGPDNLFVDEVKIDGLYSNVIIDQNRSLNFASLSKHASQEGDERQTAQSAENNETNASRPFPVKIFKVAIIDSSTDFADYSLPLTFETHIEEFGGELYNLSSQAEETSTVKLSGVVDQYGSANIDGMLVAANPKKKTDITVDFRNLALNSYSPYSAKFVGQKIDEGKLFVKLGYKIDDSQMLGENSLVIKKIKLGDDVESEEAISLPLGLAIALLEDSDGVIDIDMPVEGNVDEPDFKYGTVIWKAFSNMIGNIVTAPFRFLGSMLGIDGEELENLEFALGSSDIQPSVKEKLDALAKAMEKRPRLMLKVSGSYDAEKDGWELKKQKGLKAGLERFKNNKRAQEAKTLTIDLVEIVLEETVGTEKVRTIKKELEAKYPEEKAYDKAYEEAILNAYYESQPLTEEELVALAKDRGVQVAQYLVGKGIAADRIAQGEVVKVNVTEEGWINTGLNVEVKE